MGNGLNKVTLIDRPNGIYDYSAKSYGIEAGATSNDIESIEVDKFGRVWCGGFNPVSYTHLTLPTKLEV